jgi:hypothetical protein
VTYIYEYKIRVSFFTIQIRTENIYNIYFFYFWVLYPVATVTIVIATIYFNLFTTFIHKCSILIFLRLLITDCLWKLECIASFFSIMNPFLIF